jgi:hypothetical protein
VTPEELAAEHGLDVDRLRAVLEEARHAALDPFAWYGETGLEFLDDHLLDEDNRRALTKLTRQVHKQASRVLDLLTPGRSDAQVTTLSDACDDVERVASLIDAAIGHADGLRAALDELDALNQARPRRPAKRPSLEDRVPRAFAVLARFWRDELERPLTIHGAGPEPKSPAARFLAGAFELLGQPRTAYELKNLANAFKNSGENA